MNTYQLRCFMILASTLNYARTSEQLNTSQPAITRQIQSLEAELGTKLFYRSTRHVELTDAGNDFLADAACILDMEDRAKMRFSNGRLEEQMNLSIGCPGVSIMNMIVPALRNMKQAHPSFHPVLVNKPLSVMLPRLQDETLDIAFGARLNTDTNYDLPADCVYKELMKTRMISVRSSSYSALKSNQTNASVNNIDGRCDNKRDDNWTSRPVTMRQLAEEYLILYDPIDIPASDMKYRHILTDGRTAADTYYCSSVEEALTLAAAGIGIAIIPEIFIGSLQHGYTSAPYMSGAIYDNETGQHLSDKNMESLKTGYIGISVIADIPDISFGIYMKRYNTKESVREFCTQALYSLK